jgi:hypothetical protein
MLAKHGQSVDCALWVLKNYGSREDYKNNLTVQLWIEASRQIIIEEARRRKL